MKYVEASDATLIAWPAADATEAGAVHQSPVNEDDPDGRTPPGLLRQTA
jgi:hypothetical protein